VLIYIVLDFDAIEDDVQNVLPLDAFTLAPPVDVTADVGYFEAFEGVMDDVGRHVDVGDGEEALVDAVVEDVAQDFRLSEVEFLASLLHAPDVAKESSAERAVTMMMFKLEGALIQRNPDFQMEDRLLLDKIDYSSSYVTLGNGRRVELESAYFPTIDNGADCYELTEEEQHIIADLRSYFLESKALQRHVNYLYERGSMYMCYNGNLLFHACVPLDETGEFRTIAYKGKEYCGRAWFDFCEEKAREVIEKNIEEILKMKELTASMLDVARENGEPEKSTEISVPEFLADLKEKLAPVARGQGVKIETEMNLGKNLRASATKNTLEQILTIFADNAMKYSGEKIIYLRAGRRGKNVAFSVKDNGAGVKKEDQKRIFERFYQVDAARTRTEDKTSHGLGLAIAKNLAERQGYKIVLRSSEGRGAEFEVVV